MTATDEPTDSPLLDRLRRALGQRYRVERFLDKGGMGQVYLARDLTLGRLVAVKVIPPELATEVAVERFHREAKILADLSHPNVMPIYDFGESEGLLYYTMQYVEGETLKARIERGPIAPAEALAIARQLLEALNEAHRRGIVHRDVKPGNVMLVEERVLLTDFGIAKRSTVGGETLTEPHAFIGTLRYSAPEARSGEATAQSDLYSAGIVIYEAVSGRQWKDIVSLEEVDWSGVPARLHEPLARALAPAPADRWPDVASLRKALLDGESTRPPRVPVAVITGLAAVGCAILAWLYWPSEASSRLTLAIPRFVYAGPRSGEWVVDSITSRTRRSLDGPDVRVVHAPPRRRAASRIAGDVTLEHDTVRVALTAQSAALAPLQPAGLSSWPAAADSAAIRVWNWLYSRAEGGALTERATPRRPDAFGFFLHGELLFAQARWHEAADAYERAEDLDASCLLCSWRLFEVARWLAAPPDTARFRRLLEHVGDFPPHYQAVIRAAMVPTTERIDSLKHAAEGARDFRTAWFHLAEELFHRGPLLGRSRRDAEHAYLRVTQLDSTFVPAWHHLTWLRAAEGDRAGAEAAGAIVRRVDLAAPPLDSYARAFSAYVGVGFAWRFQPPDSAKAFTEMVLADPRIASFEDVGAGARFLVAFDAPRGAVTLAPLIRELGLPTVRSTLLAEVFGNTALGRPDSARQAAVRLRVVDDAPEIALFTAQLDASVALFGPRRPPAVLDSIATRLAEFARPYPGADERRRRAAYLLVLLGRAAGHADDRQLLALLAGMHALRPLATLLEADAMARGGAFTHAITHAQGLIGAPDSGNAVPDPFFRTIHHLLRAGWYAEEPNIERSRRELSWFENSDIEGGYPSGDPKNAEVDWAFGTEARWRRARLLDNAGSLTPLVCDGYRAVVRHWTDGEPAYAARADTARARLAALNCSA